MVLKYSELFLNDTPSKFNKELLEFIKRNLEVIILKGQIKFKFKIVSTRDLSNLKNRGIKRLPAMIIDNKSFIGVPDIIFEIRKRVKLSKETAKPKSDDETLNEYFMNTLEHKVDENGKINIKDDDDNDDDNGQKLASAAIKEAERRKIVKDESKIIQKKSKNEEYTDELDLNLNTDLNFGNNNSRNNKDLRIGNNNMRNNNERNNERPNNILPEAGDPITTLEKMQQKGNSDSVDDQLLSALLAKME